MAISKATRWITFGSTPSAPAIVQQATVSPALAPVYGSDEKQFGFTNVRQLVFAAILLF